MWKHLETLFCAYSCHINVSDEIKVEDVLSSLLNMWALEVAQHSHLVALSRRVPRLYFSGSFLTREEIRNLITRELTQRQGMFSVSFDRLLYKVKRMKLKVYEMFYIKKSYSLITNVAGCRLWSDFRVPVLASGQPSWSDRSVCFQPKAKTGTTRQ